MLKSLEAALHNGRLLERGQRVGVAVSGGADSIALLTALHELSPEWRFLLTVLHVNHGLRGAESDNDEQFVRKTAAEMGLSVLVQRQVLEPGNLEQAARDSRYSWFRELLTGGQLDRVATGHTSSDQAETVLFRFLRGAGSAGLAGIRPAISGGIVRPLLGISREEVRRYLCTHGIIWREDSSNGDIRFARNRIRRKLLPDLTREWNPALAEVLNQTAEWARAEEEYWEGEIARLAAGCVRFGRDAAVFSCPALAALPVAAARRVVRFAISRVKGDLRQVDFLHVERILELAGRPKGEGRLQIPGLNAQRSFDWLRLAEIGAVAPDYRRILQVPGDIRLPAGDTTLRLELKSTDSVYNTSGHQLDWGLVSGSLELRNWRPGDQYRQAGHTSEIKLKYLFQKARVPAWERRQWPVITVANSIVWTRKFGPAAGLVPSGDARAVLWVREIPNQIV